MCEISYFMKPLEISVNPCSYCFTRGLHEITKIPRHFTKSRNFCTSLFLKSLNKRNALIPIRFNAVFHILLTSTVT